MTINKSFKKCIEKVKFEFSITQKEIANRIGVHNTYLSDMINGRVPLTDQVSNKIYELFHIEVETESLKNLHLIDPKPDAVHEPPVELFLCPECVNKKRVIDAQAETILTLKKQIELLEFMLGKYRKNGSG